MALADLNGDTFLDVAVVNEESNDVSVLLGNGDGTLRPQDRYPVGAEPNSIAAGDFNKDGWLDLVTANVSSYDVSILFGTGQGKFGPQQTLSFSTSYRVAVADLNNDGNLDLVIGNHDSTITLLLGRGDGTFLTPSPVATSIGAISVAIADVNGDGKLDLVTEGDNDLHDYDVQVILGVGDGTFGPPQRFSAGASPDSIAVIDMNGDGLLDIVTANSEPGDVSILLHQ